MAILRNREVTYLGPVSGHDSSKAVRVEDKYGNIEIVKLSELRFTEDEINDMVEAEKNQLSGLATISDKDLKQLRESQDPDKVQEAKDRGETLDTPDLPAYPDPVAKSNNMDKAKAKK